VALLLSTLRDPNQCQEQVKRQIGQGGFKGCSRDALLADIDVQVADEEQLADVGYAAVGLIHGYERTFPCGHISSWCLVSCFQITLTARQSDGEPRAPSTGAELLRGRPGCGSFA
jgi:hypothetical protein